MKVSSVSQINFFAGKNSSVNSKRNINYLSVTGYSALGAGILSGVAAGAKKFKAHKYLAYLSGALALAHLGIAEIQKYRYRRGQNSAG